MQRSHRLMYSHESALCARLKFRRASASGVNGTLPSGGSITSEVRIVFTTDVPESNQIALYVPGSPSEGGASERACVASHCAASSFVRNALSLNCAGRSNGVSVGLVQMPCRSGWPSGVRGGVQDDWLRIVRGATATKATIAIERIKREAFRCLLIEPPSEAQSNFELRITKLDDH